jgi:ADP-dependent NAD(P)H-hydrate dehydratase / NAD(P)H-hydrate epimerase
MKVLTAAQMREVDRLTIERGIPGLILMENAGNRVVDAMEREFAPLAAHRIVVLCGKGNNGGDGFVIARQLHTRILPQSLTVVLTCDPALLKGDAAANYRMLEVCGCPVTGEITPEMRDATLVVDALLGTGVNGPAQGRIADFISAINHSFPHARVVAVDLPSSMVSDEGDQQGEIARADLTVTFTAAKISQAMPPNCDRLGKLIVAPIGSPDEIIPGALQLLEPGAFRRLAQPRKPSAHKGDFGHVLVVGGSRGKTGAAAMTGMAALRAGAGLVTVATSASALPVIAAHAAELMTEALEETDTGAIRDLPQSVLDRKTLLAVGPGLGTHPDTVALVRRLAFEHDATVVLDADGLNALPTQFEPFRYPRVLTPHPGEMARLCGLSTKLIQQDRLAVARRYATERNCVLVLKGQRSLIALPDGRVWINPSGSPAMATGGSGDILTGLIAGLIAQFPNHPHLAVAFAVWMHGRAGELGAAEWGEPSLVATDLLKYLPKAFHEASGRD